MKEFPVLEWLAVCDTEVSDAVAELKIQDLFPRMRDGSDQESNAQQLRNIRAAGAYLQSVCSSWTSGAS